MTPKKTGIRRTARALRTAVILTFSCVLTGCGLIPQEEPEHRINTVTGDVSSKYSLAMAELHDVELVKNIVCTYSRLNEQQMYFSVGGYSVGSVYVSEGDAVRAGDPLAALDMSPLEEAVNDCSDLILEKELDIRQNSELIDYYRKKSGEPGTNLLDREEYSVKIRECEETVTAAKSAIEFAQARIEEYGSIIENSVIYAETDGTVSYIKKDLSGWVADADTEVMRILAPGESAFTADDAEACGYLKAGSHVVISKASGEEYGATVSSLDQDSGRIVFELDEPDYSISVGTRANISLVIDSRQQVLAVPRIAVYGGEDGYYVYVLTEDGVREPVDIEVGLIGNNYAEVTGGLEMYDSVIVR